MWFHRKSKWSTWCFIRG